MNKDGNQADEERATEEDKSQCTTNGAYKLNGFGQYGSSLVFMVIPSLIGPPILETACVQPFFLLHFFYSLSQNSQICIHNVCRLPCN